MSIYDPNHRYMDDVIQNVINKAEIINEMIKVANSEVVAIWPLGEDTEYLFKLVNVPMDRFIFVDKTVKEFKGEKVRHPQDILWADVSKVLISSFMYQEEIEKELINVYHYKGEIIKLYDGEKVPFYKFDSVEFYSNQLQNDDSIKGTFNEEMLKCEIEEFCCQIEKKSRFNMQYLILDKCDGLRTKPLLCGGRNDDVAIILQGVIKYDNDYTLNSIRLYKRLFPGVHIVLSTSEGEKEKERFRCFFDEKDIDVVFRKEMVDGGLGNIDKQLISTYNALVRIKTVCPGVKYVLKTRADMRVNSPEALAYLKSLYCDESNCKILCAPVTWNEKFYFYDYCNFGEINEMLEFWKPRAEKITIRGVEIYLYSRYAGVSQEEYFSLPEDEYRAIVKLKYIFFDLRNLVIHWDKYEHYVIGQDFPSGDHNRLYPSEHRYF